MEIKLIKTLPSPNAKYLVFTSAGDKACLDRWLTGYRNFDLWVNYYGNEENRYREHSDYYTVRKGGKFPNLHYVYHRWVDVFKHYQAILIMDDDLIIDGSAISRLFGIRDEYALWLLQPAFSPRGKISHGITRVRPLTFLRYTNFVELACPLFRQDKLDDFMKVYDPDLVGYGLDYWYMDVLGPDIIGKVAIVDDITCINPHDWRKGGFREIDRLRSVHERKMKWEKIKEQYHIQVRDHREFDSIKRSLSFSIIIDAITILTSRETFRNSRKKIKNILRRFI